MKLTEAQEKWIGGIIIEFGDKQKVINYINDIILKPIQFRGSSWGKFDIDYKKIKCAAIKLGDSVQQEYKNKVISGYRHDDCYHNMMAMGMEPTGEEIQGFINLNNEFLTREEAALVAFEKGQITEKKDMLFSEDLY